MKVLILGDGLLGTEIQKQTGWDYYSRKKDGFDITSSSSFQKLGDLIQSNSYTTIFNCIGNTDSYSSDKQKHWDVNYRGVLDLVDFCNTYNLKLIHISSDSVYGNCDGIPTEEDVPMTVATQYSHCKVLADGYVQIRSKDYLLIRCSFKKKPFPYPGAWVDQIGNFDYVDVIGNLIIKLIKGKATGIYNVGTELKLMYDLACQTNPNVHPIRRQHTLMPNNTSMDISKMKAFFANQSNEI